MTQSATSIALAESALVERHLRLLVDEIGPRPPGSEGNTRANEHIARVLDGAGWQVRALPFDCRVWQPGAVTLRLEGRELALEPAPFSPPSRAAGRIKRMSTASELAAAEPDLSGTVVLLAGELAAEAYFPKAFPFLTLDHQQAVISQLEARRPAAVLAVALADQPRAPVFEDGDLEFAYSTVPADVEPVLVDGLAVELVVGGSIEEARGQNVSARFGPGDPSIVLCAHMDTKATTPGAIDNGGGVAALLALVEGGLRPARPTEVVFFNGEDHYAAPGEQAWLAEADMAALELAVNVDGAGARGRLVEVSSIGAGPGLAGLLEDLIARHSGIVAGEPWFESDHALFAQAGVPSLAITSADAGELTRDVCHGPTDTLEMVDAALLGQLVRFLRELLSR